MNSLSTKRDSRSIKACLADNRSDFCEHVEESKETAYAVFCEDDSFGPVGRRVVCKDCHDRAIGADNCSLVRCQDCCKDVTKSDTREWRWYDFYAAQGDEPRVICNECWKAPKHVARMDDDDDSYDEEMGRNKRVGVR